MMKVKRRGEERERILVRAPSDLIQYWRRYAARNGAYLNDVFVAALQLARRIEEQGEGQSKGEPDGDSSDR